MDSKNYYSASKCNYTDQLTNNRLYMKRRDLALIASENKKFLDRLQEQKSAIDFEKLEQERSQ